MNSFFIVLLVLVLQCFLFETNAQFQPFGSKEYLIETGAFVRSYAQAEERCSQLGSTMAEVNTEEIGQFIVNNRGNFSNPPYSFYIGLRRIGNNSDSTSFQWSDGTSLTRTWSNWLAGEPNNSPVGDSGEESCVIMGWTFELDPLFKWRDVSCDFLARYICERPIETSISTGTVTTRIMTSSDSTSAVSSASPTTASTITSVSISNQEIIIYAAIGGGGLLIIVIVVITICLCHSKKKTNPKTNPHDPHVIYETIESSYGSRQPVYNEIYKSADLNGGADANGGYLVPGRHGTNAYSQIYLRPDGSLYQDHMEPPPVPSTLPKRDRKPNAQATNI